MLMQDRLFGIGGAWQGNLESIILKRGIMSRPGAMKGNPYSAKKPGREEIVQAVEKVKGEKWSVF